MSIIPQPITQFPWRVMALLLAIAVFGTLVLYSAAGGSIFPWATNQAVRFCIFSAMALVLSRIPLEIFARFAFPAYGHLKLSGIVESLATLLFRLSGEDSRMLRETYRAAIWAQVRKDGADQLDGSGGSASGPVTFFRTHDLAFRIRRLRFLARHLADTLESEGAAEDEAVLAMHDAIYRALALYAELGFGEVARRHNYYRRPHGRVDALVLQWRPAWQGSA